MKRVITVLSFMALVLALITIQNSKLKMQVSLLQEETEDLKGQREELQRENRTYKADKENIEKDIIALKIYIEDLKVENKDLKVENEDLRIIRAKLTAYSPYDNVDGQQAEGDPSRTSIGKTAGRGIVAADPKKLPYGTILDIPGWGEVEVGDTGGALRRDNKNIRLDLYHNTYIEAMAFGVQDKDVKIVKWGEDLKNGR